MEKIEKKDWAGLGFASGEQFEAAKALVAECAKFGGMEALDGKTPSVGDGAQAELSARFVCMPRSLLSEVAAGPAGRLGRSVLGAPGRLASKPVARFDKPKSRAENSSAAPPGDDFLDASDFAQAMDGHGFGKGAWGGQAKPAPSRRIAVEEGEGEDSFDAIISKLEANGFGDPAAAELIRKNKAKARGKKP